MSIKVICDGCAKETDELDDSALCRCRAARAGERQRPMLKTKEHADLIDSFEREMMSSSSNFSGRLDKECKDLWPKGIIYQDGNANELFLAYRRGYAFGKAVWLNRSSDDDLGEKD